MKTVPTSYKRNIFKTTLQKTFGVLGYTISQKDIKQNPQHLNQVTAKDFFDLYFSLIDPQNFFFIQFGANDGSFVDPMYDYVKHYNLTGVLVEPQKDVFNKLKTNYKNQNNVTFANIAISNTDGEKILYTISDDLKNKDDLFNRMTGIASFDRDLLLKSLQYEFLKKSWHAQMKEADRYIVETKVTTLTFKSFIKKYGIKQIDYIQMDCEGYDYEIIKMIDLGSRFPKIINFESTHLSDADRKECEEMLAANGYRTFRHRFDTCAYRI